jgi:hypothetical protein
MTVVAIDQAAGHLLNCYSSPFVLSLLLLPRGSFLLPIMPRWKNLLLINAVEIFNTAGDIQTPDPPFIKNLLVSC